MSTLPSLNRSPKATPLLARGTIRAAPCFAASSVKVPSPLFFIQDPVAGLSMILHRSSVAFGNAHRNGIYRNRDIFARLDAQKDLP